MLVAAVGGDVVALRNAPLVLCADLLVTGHLVPPRGWPIYAHRMPGIANATRMGPVHLTVADLTRSLEYYQRSVGLQVHDRENTNPGASGMARLGAGGEDLLVLYEQPGAEPAPLNTGLFHYALLLPARADLARWLVHAANEELPLEGM